MLKREYFELHKSTEDLHRDELRNYSYRFPRSIIRQMTSVESIRIFKLENLILSTSDLDFLCQFEKLIEITLRHIPMNLQYIPRSCETSPIIVLATLKNERSFCIMKTDRL